MRQAYLLSILKNYTNGDTGGSYLMWIIPWWNMAHRIMKRRWPFLRMPETAGFLPALFPNDPSLNYKNLPLVHKGDEASNTYKDLGNHTKKEQETIRHGLLVYCELDTFAMVKIYEKLIEVTK